MGPKTRALMIGLGVGITAGALLAQHSMDRHRKQLFSGRPLRRLSALGYLNSHPSVEAVHLLQDYLAWEQHPMLRRRAEAIVRRMEAKLGS
ncbi:MAG: hypothetical protein JSW71_24190 [Gemmatimonadota bacterium]|nr:MAG: hypothetical protein JSW71_24190 [Gemmatimonadota bacterium]